MDINSRFQDGIWYDYSDESFCKFRVTGETVSLVTPDGDDEYHTFTSEDEFNPSDFVRVPQQAVDDPATYLQSFIDDLHSGSLPTAGVSISESVGIQYADEHTELVER